MPRPHELSVARDALEQLFDEIGRYLDVVDAFRREGREPIWRLERRRMRVRLTLLPPVGQTDS